MEKTFSLPFLASNAEVPNTPHNQLFSDLNNQHKYSNKQTIYWPPCWRTKDFLQHGGSILGSVILCGTFDEYLSFGTTHTP